jgi:hypothetical protein
MPEHPGGQQRVRPVLQAVAEPVRDDDHVGASGTYGRFAVSLRPILEPPAPPWRSPLQRRRKPESVN